MSDERGWWARGLLFENCNCQIVCPGHTHFTQKCTHERCVGYWAIRFDEGVCDGTDLAGLRAVVTYDSPRRMIDGDWVESLFIDDAASERQRAAVERILTGEMGGPWRVLARFVGRREPTRFVPIEIGDAPGRKTVVVEGVLDSSIEPIRGRDRAAPVRLENMFNQVHAPSQVVAAGRTRTPGGAIQVDDEASHGLWSRFEWSVNDPGSRE